MSLILDALRKMELERKVKRLNSTEIRTDVLNYRGTPQATERSRLLPVLVALLLFSSATTLILYFKRAAPPPVEAVTAPAPAVTDNPVRSAAPQTNPQLPTGSQLPATGTHRPVGRVAPEAIAGESRQAAGDERNIAVSGIAWQEEHSLRRAVINGALVSEGTEVSGAKVVEIRENLVRFSHNGRTFEVSYTSGSGH